MEQMSCRRESRSRTTSSEANHLSSSAKQHFEKAIGKSAVANKMSADGLPQMLLQTQTGRKPVRRSHLKTHLPTPSGEKSFECAVCNKKFSQGSVLKRHLLTHTGGKCFECAVCNKKFGRVSVLKTHLLTHTGEKSFECAVCNKKFSQGSKLKTPF
ncbi:oocyte zinc finger protein XlCOF6-like [Thrips palmi]|uniref:Oocyte zinc finger protein XlCOF6-like n=1 Tax=Thrips palmi TaxID=161013 RepID=A0A6P9A807_THRPL|nr:oocyte zinc finger protein XlCOF6-like [Thrips palmi]